MMLYIYIHIYSHYYCHYHCHYYCSYFCYYYYVYIYILAHILSHPSQGSILSFEEVNLIQQEMFVELCLVPDTSCRDVTEMTRT